MNSHIYGQDGKARIADALDKLKVLGDKPVDKVATKHGVKNEN